MNRTRNILLGIAAILGATTAALAADITGAGATFPAPIYVKWAALYKGAAGVGLNYQAIGSGGGIAQIKAKTVTFGATDRPLTPPELNAAGLVQFPTVIGGVVPVVNIPGIRAGQLVLDGPTLAAIYMGRIKRWDDPAIKKLNPGLNLPPRPVGVVHRSDGSGTTFIFATFLSRVSPQWKEEVGADTAIDWPTGIGAKGNEGVAGNVAKIGNTIGYVEYAYAKQNHLTYVKLRNRAGQAVEPTVDAFRSAASSADWAAAAKNNFHVILVDQPGAASWPITATTYILVYRNPAVPAMTAATLKFFKWGFEQGDDAALSLDYVPLPDNAVQAIETSWKGIQGSGM
jgi:phosphate transport system substrate-binding protein